MAPDPDDLVASARLELHLVPVSDLIVMLEDPEDPGPWTDRPFSNPHRVLRDDPGPLHWRVASVRQDPSVNRWLLRLVVLRSTHEVVGSVSFHDAPDPTGMVEVGVTIHEAFRRRGYAREALTALWLWAVAQESVRTLRYTVSPQNLASVRMVEGFGFVLVGRQLDEIDGPEDIYEMPAAQFAEATRHGFIGGETMTPVMDPIELAIVAGDDHPAETVVTDISSAPRRETRRPPRRDRVRMSGHERREQLLDVGRRLFAEKGFEAVSVEEIAAKAGVSKPVVYEHFGGKEGLYAVLVDREMTYLLVSIAEALGDDGDGHEVTNARVLLERAALALFDYIDRYPDGFRILVRDAPAVRDPEVRASAVGSSGTFAGLLVDVAAKVDDLLAKQFRAHEINPKWAPLYSQMLVGMVAQTGQWWLDVRKPKKEEVVAHLVNLAWNGLQNMEPKPRLVTKGH